MRTQRIYLVGCLAVLLLVGLTKSQAPVDGLSLRSDQKLDGAQRISGQISAARTLSSGQTCGQSNPFLSYFKNTWKVSTVSQSITTSGYCGAEWSTYGSCCHVVDAMAAINQDRIQIANAKALFVRYFNQFPSVAKQFYWSIRRLSEASLGGRPKSEADVVRAAKTFIQSGKLANVMAKVAQFDSDWERSIYQQQMDQCWNYNSQLRSSAVCSYCSSRGHEFFNWNQKGVVECQLCDGIINQCFEAHKKSIIMIKAWKKMLNSIDTWKDTGVEINVDEMTLNFKNQFAQFDEDRVAEDIDSNSMTFMQLASLGSFERARFCQKFVKLAYRPFIVDFYDNLNKYASWNLKLSKHASKVLSSRRRLLANIKPSVEAEEVPQDQVEGRSLLSFDWSPFSTFISDSDFEPPQVAYAQARGRCMNMTLMFA